ncbi:MAG: hypothetical protein JJLCMIEE_00653 [Acidimicrobiales bacterium]|nr:hypothetical protein [Acidimicrobiales bacterium]
MSPSAIVLTGVGAAVGILVGLGPIGAVGLAAVAWAARVGAAVPRGPRAERIDPFTLPEPWRFYVRDALQAQSRYNEAVHSTPEGPLHDRLFDIGTRVDQLTGEAWKIARRGNTLAEAAKRIDVTQVQKELDEIGPQASEVWAAGTSIADTAKALTSQLQSAERMHSLAAQADGMLKVLNARLDELVARTIELSVHADSVSETGGLGTEVDNLLGELEALRGALEETTTGSVPLPEMPPATAPHADSAPEPQARPTTLPPSEPAPTDDSRSAGDTDER